MVQRSYAEEVVTKLDALKSGEALEVVEYGKLAYESDVPSLSLFAAKSRAWDPARPAVLVTGGVHGYETSGVQGALRFLSTAGAGYAAKVNLVVAPCISPWGYERIQRWNAEAVDPNRSFRRVGDASVAAGAGSEAVRREARCVRVVVCARPCALAVCPRSALSVRSLCALGLRSLSVWCAFGGGLQRRQQESHA